MVTDDKDGRFIYVGEGVGAAEAVETAEMRLLKPGETRSGMLMFDFMHGPNDPFTERDGEAARIGIGVTFAGIRSMMRNPAMAGSRLTQLSLKDKLDGQAVNRVAIDFSMVQDSVGIAAISTLFDLIHDMGHVIAKDVHNDDMESAKKYTTISLWLSRVMVAIAEKKPYADVGADETTLGMLETFGHKLVDEKVAAFLHSLGNLPSPPGLGKKGE